MEWSTGATFETPGLREITQRLLTFTDKLQQRRAFTRAARAGGLVIRNLARGKVGVVSGKLRRSIRVSVKITPGYVRARVFAGRAIKKDDPYWALFVHQGTRAHEIRPAGKKSLFLAGLAREVVKHPGSKGNPFLRDALEEGGEAAVQAIGDVMRQEFADLEYRGWL